ncbi:hypothetical protein PPERSA_11294 [Pseudocohnilembus persalinus]|uniref:VOC domain-containing protein n=1 Tax=Pseudocohnilembus persalinus TaxID=266149 RepID=A0A0V0QQ44_PSEPJ|nr:hypothetical protein PPERSA_11294 [Pseudocohnilembus persalinus]|eukprot:KRX04170.1 hypothetical protein PPERSA_11294 [Pseudocohnilembus persalinus]
MNINGIAHIILSVNNVQKSKLFYEPLLTYMGMKKVKDEKQFLYFVGGRTAIGLEQRNILTNEDYQITENQQNVGLHHFCLRAKSREDVDKAYQKVKTLPNANIVQSPIEKQWAPGYYYTLFEDPDGIRIEVNFVPGKGLLETKKKVEFNAKL